MNLRSRKVVSWIVGQLIIIALYIASLFVMKQLGTFEAAIAPMFAAAVGAIMTLNMAFIGGTVWADWIKSKYYQEALDDSVPQKQGRPEGSE